MPLIAWAVIVSWSVGVIVGGLAMRSRRAADVARALAAVRAAGSREPLGLTWRWPAPPEL